MESLNLIFFYIDIMVFINNTQNNTLQRSFTHTGPGRESDEEDLPVFQEVTDTRIPNNEEADIHELSRTGKCLFLIVTHLLKLFHYVLKNILK